MVELIGVVERKVETLATLVGSYKAEMQQNFDDYQRRPLEADVPTTTITSGASVAPALKSPPTSPRSLAEYGVWLEGAILQAYSEIDTLGGVAMSLQILDHKEALKWMVNKLELLRLKLFREEVSVGSLASAKPLIEAALTSLQMTHYFRDEETKVLEFLAGLEEEPEDLFDEDDDGS